MFLIDLIYFILLFAFCLIIISLIRFAKIGLRYVKTPPKTEEAIKESTPVYYLVERKRTKKKYHTPKEIKFK